MSSEATPVVEGAKSAAPKMEEEVRYIYRLYVAQPSRTRCGCRLWNTGLRALRSILFNGNFFLYERGYL